MSKEDDRHGGYDPVRMKCDAYEVETGTSTADGTGDGTVTFSAPVWWILVINETDDDDLEVQAESLGWIPLPETLKWLSIPVPADTETVKVKHSASAQTFTVVGWR